jgi:hypothetical protein
MRNPLEEFAIRIFVVDPHGTAQEHSVDSYVAHMGVSPAAHAAFDLMYDDGMDAEKAWELAFAMDKQSSPRGDAEAQARHLVELRKAARSWQ